MVTQAEPLYLNLSADDPDLGTTEIESLCMNCMENVSMPQMFHELACSCCCGFLNNPII